MRASGETVQSGVNRAVKVLPKPGKIAVDPARDDRERPVGERIARKPLGKRGSSFGECYWAGHGSDRIADSMSEMGFLGLRRSGTHAALSDTINRTFNEKYHDGGKCEAEKQDRDPA